jgi:hypothetical protein
MYAAKVFFSFTEISDPTRHRDYNAWHQLDHRPENLALPGVIYGERWVRSPDCAQVGQASDPRFEHFHYLNMYWFREPVEESRREWQDLGARSIQWGRRPELAWAKRNLLQFCEPVKGYVHPRVLVTADVLPFRPTRGIWVTVSQVVGDMVAAEDLYRWYDEVRIPDMVACRGCPPVARAIRRQWNTCSSPDRCAGSSHGSGTGSRKATGPESQRADERRIR